jgi:hypothetical protein
MLVVLLLLLPVLLLTLHTPVAFAQDDLLAQPRELTINGTLPSSSTGTGGFTPDQPLPPEDTFSSTGGSGSSGGGGGRPSSQVPSFPTQPGIWSYRCCSKCQASCGGYFVKRICLNRTTEVPIDKYHCSRIPAVPVDSYLEWAMQTCSRAGCPTWDWDDTKPVYNHPTLTCGASLAWPVTRCQFNNRTVFDDACWPARRPAPKLVNQPACGDSIPLLPFQPAAAIAPFAPRQFFDVAAMNRTLFVVGGLVKNSVANRIADVWRSDDYGQNWQAVGVKTPAFTTVQDHTLEVLGGSLIAVGGIEDALPSPNVWRSDNKGVDWYLTAYMQYGRAQHDSAIFLKGIVVVGGFTANSVKNDVLLSTDAAHWYVQTNSAPWAPRTYPSIDVVQDTLVLVGGWLTSGVAAVDLWKTYDLVTWTQVAAVTPWSARVGFVFYSTHRQLVLLGGISQSGQTYFQDQWISGDSGVTWQLRSAKASTSSSLSATSTSSDPTSSSSSSSGSGSGSSSVPLKPLSMRSWAGYTKMEGDRLFVMGGEYQGRLLNDVWLGDRSIQSTIAANSEPTSSSSSSSGLSAGFIAIVVCAVIGGVFCLAVAIVLVRHSKAKAAEKKSRADAAIALQQISVSLQRDGGAPPLVLAAGEAVSPDAGVPVAGQDDPEAARGLLASSSSRPHRLPAAASRSSNSSSSGSSPSGSGGATPNGATPKRHRSRTPSGRPAGASRQSSGIPAAPGNSRQSSGSATVPGVKRSRKASGPNGRSSRQSSSDSTPRHPHVDSVSPPSANPGAPSSAASSTPVLRHLGAPIVAGSPPPPYHLAWMRAQGSPQAMQQRPDVPEAEEYFRSVPQLAPAQAQLLYIVPSSLQPCSSPSAGVVASAAAPEDTAEESMGSRAEGHPATAISPSSAASMQPYSPFSCSSPVQPLEEELQPGQPLIERSSGEAAPSDPQKDIVRASAAAASRAAGHGNGNGLSLQLYSLEEIPEGEDSPASRRTSVSRCEGAPR